MKFTQTQKETIFNNYMMLVDKLAEHLDHKSEISPKEIVYAVLGLVEDQTNSCVHEFQREGPDYWVCKFCNEGHTDNLLPLSTTNEWSW